MCVRLLVYLIPIILLFLSMRTSTKSCLLFFSRRAKAVLESPLPIKDGFSVIDNVLHYISGKTKIKEHFAEMKVTAPDFVESAIGYEKRIQATR